MAEREQHDGAGRTGRRLMDELKRIANAELQLASRSLREATRASARSAAFGGAGAVTGMLSLGLLGAGLGLKLAGRPARPALLACLLFTSASAMLLSRALREMPTDTLGELRGNVRAQLHALKS